MNTLYPSAITGLPKPKASFTKSITSLATPLIGTKTSTSHPISSPSSPPYNRDYPLFNMDALRIPPRHRPWFAALNLSIRTVMNTLDASHNYQHIRRVVSIAHRILETEADPASPTAAWACAIDPTVLWVACMTHDIGDAKYRAQGDTRTQEDVVLEFLATHNCPGDIMREVAKAAAGVSFSAELRDRAAVQRLAALHPALRIVQDADRVDALGAVGVGRCFVFGGVMEARRYGLIESGIRLMEERFAVYGGLMKTETGRRMAEERYNWMIGEFVTRWRKEADTSNV